MNSGWLTGWKQIANYCGVSKDTAKVYEKNHGLPIRRLPKGRPVAIPNELDKWLKEKKCYWHEKT